MPEKPEKRMRTVCSCVGIPEACRPSQPAATCACSLPPSPLLPRMFDFSICWPSEEGKKKSEKGAATAVGPKSTTSTRLPLQLLPLVASPLSLCLLLLLLQPFIIHSPPRPPALSAAASAHIACRCAARSHFNAFLSFAAKQVQFSPQKQQQTAAATAAQHSSNNNNPAATTTDNNCRYTKTNYRF